MAIQTINVGNVKNDGSGDDLRTAFVKVNANFTELNNQNGQNNTASNIGSGVGIYKEKVGVDLRLRSLLAGDGISVTQNPTEVSIINTDHNTVVAVNDAINSIDFGNITATTNGLQFLFQITDIDFGSFTTPSSLSINGGSFV